MHISICIPVVYGTYLRDCLDSVFGNNFQDFEVVVNDSSNNPSVSDILRNYDLKIINMMTKNFESRFITANASKGEKIFLFDETRLMQRTLLTEISLKENDMLVIKEKDIGKGIINFFSNLDKSGIPNEISLLNPITNKSIIPRVYKREIILSAMEKIKRKLPENILKEIVGLDLELIYYESYNITSNIGIINSPEIMHYGDESISDFFRKYYKYGYTQKMIRYTQYREMANLSGRNRLTLPLRNKIASIPIQLLRGPPFILGYLHGGGNQTVPFKSD